MEIRKVQKTGGSSYVITLPKAWINKLGIKEKDQLALITQPDGTILVSADINRDKIFRKKEILIDELEEEQYIQRLLIGSYIMGFNYIKITSKGKLSTKIRKYISEFTRTAIGPIVDEENINSIVLKDILDPTEMPFHKSVKRMNIVLRTMHEDIINALKEKDSDLINDIILRDREINKRHWLIARQTNMVLRDVILSQKMGVNLEDAHHYFLISKQLERTGDHAKKFANNAELLINENIDAKLIDKIAEISKQSLDYIDESLEAWYKKDLHLANISIDSVEKVFELCEEIDTRKMDNKISIPLNQIIESIKRTAEYAANIAEIVVDNLIKSENIFSS